MNNNDIIIKFLQIVNHPFLKIYLNDHEFFSSNLSFSSYDVFHVQYVHPLLAEVMVSLYLFPKSLNLAKSSNGALPVVAILHSPMNNGLPFHTLIWFYTPGIPSFNICSSFIYSYPQIRYLCHSYQTWISVKAKS